MYICDVGRRWDLYIGAYSAQLFANKSYLNIQSVFAAFGNAARERKTANCSIQFSPAQLLCVADDNIGLADKKVSGVSRRSHYRVFPPDIFTSCCFMSIR